MSKVRISLCNKDTVRQAKWSLMILNKGKVISMEETKSKPTANDLEPDVLN